MSQFSSVPNLFSQGHQQAPYDHFSIEQRHEYDSGVMKMELSAPLPNGQTAILCQIYAPQSRRTVEFDASRMGSKPVLPSPIDIDFSTTAFIGSVIVAGNPDFSDDGGQGIYNARGVYTYELFFPNPPTAGILQGGASPAATLQSSDNRVDSVQFTTGLL